SNNDKTNQTTFTFKLDYLWKINKRNYIFIQNQTGNLISDNLFVNELYRIGGVNSIRGFNEESIFVSGYSVFNLEYRYKLNNSSYLYSISDYAYIKNDINKINTNNFGLGLGYSFLTKVGRINMSYAIGKFEEESFDFNNSKIHINMASFF
ncbi:MAG: hypothetical protein ABFS12_13585, partial [Bacteroidota bacterium]